MINKNESGIKKLNFYFFPNSNSFNNHGNLHSYVRNKRNHKKSQGLFPKNKLSIKITLMFVKFLVFFQIESINSSFHIYCREVSCDNIGICKIRYSEKNEYIPSQFSVNIYQSQDKNLKEDKKNNFYLNNTPANVYNNNRDPKIGLLYGSSYYQCADGLNECPDKCCKLGICSDPSNVCLKQKSNRDLILIITGSIFSLMTIIYWIIFFYLGIKYNSTFLESKNIKNLDMIYRKPFIKSGDHDPPDTEFDPNINYEFYNKKKEEEEKLFENEKNIGNNKDTNSIITENEKNYEIQVQTGMIRENYEVQENRDSCEENLEIIDIKKKSIVSEKEDFLNEYKKVDVNDENYNSMKFSKINNFNQTTNPNVETNEMNFVDPISKKNNSNLDSKSYSKLQNAESDSHRGEDKINIFAPKILNPRILKKKLIKRNTNSVNKSENSNCDSKIDKDPKNLDIITDKQDLIDKNGNDDRISLNSMNDKLIQSSHSKKYSKIEDIKENDMSLGDFKKNTLK